MTERGSVSLWVFQKEKKQVGVGGGRGCLVMEQC